VSGDAGSHSFVRVSRATGQLVRVGHDIGDGNDTGRPPESGRTAERWIVAPGFVAAREQHPDDGHGSSPRFGRGLTQRRGDALCTGEGDARQLVARQSVDLEIACAVQPNRRVDYVAAPTDTRPKELTRLRHFLFGQR
jgi:hypothetical protein